MGPGGPWEDFSEFRGEMFSHQFAPWWQNHSFVICAHGGGLDPSPRAFMAIAAGAIPIVKHSALDAAYSHLPVVFVDNWTADAITLDKLKQWKADLVPYYDDPRLRVEVVKRLTMKYWWKVAL